MISISTLTSVVDFFTDKAQAMLDARTNSANLLRDDAKNSFTVKVVADFTGTAIDDYVALYQCKAGADVLWHQITAVINGATGLQGDVGVLDTDGTFTKYATLGTHTGNVCRTTAEAYANSRLAEGTWVVIQLKTAAPTGSAAFYLPYIALA